MPTRPYRIVLQQHIATMLALCFLTVAVPASAGSATAQFFLRLVISPRCDGDGPPIVPDVTSAAKIAERYLGLSGGTAQVDHDVADTGYWLVSANGESILRINKCTGELSEPHRESADIGSGGQLEIIESKD